MKLTFIGAAHEVTGSCTLLDCCGGNFLIDYGMEQGVNVFENVPLPVLPGQIDAVFLTHAHIDHSGMLPKLYKDGFRGKVYATRATENLCRIMLMDSANIQVSDAEWMNRRAARAGRTAVDPVYTTEDAAGVLRLLRPCSYAERIKAAEGVEVRFTDVGHLLGAACVELWLTEGGETRKLVFSGDVGNTGLPLIGAPLTVDEADYLVIESTYGNRLHEKPGDTVAELAAVLQRAFDRGGSVIVPAFAVGRTQELLYYFRQIKQAGLVKSFPDFPVYVDSPLAIEATAVFNRNEDSCYDEEAVGFVRKGVNPISFKGLNIAVTSDESRAINFNKTPKVIISASGMCEAGRIKHHLKHNLWRSECTVLFVGYQAVGTLGRKLVEGAKNVKLFGEDINVAAKILVLPGMSGHADKAGLDRWIRALDKPQVFVIHGEAESAESYTAHLHDDFGLDSHCPYSGAELDLLTGEFVNAKPMPAVHTERESTPYIRLKAAADRLQQLVKMSSGLTNKELAAMTDTLNNLCAKWEQK